LSLNVIALETPLDSAPFNRDLGSFVFDTLLSTMKLTEWAGLAPGRPGPPSALHLSLDCTPVAATFLLNVLLVFLWVLGLAFWNFFMGPVLAVCSFPIPVVVLGRPRFFFTHRDWDLSKKVR